MTLSRLEVNCQAYNTAITACEKNANWQVFRAGRKDGYFVEGPNFGNMELDNNWICRIIKRAGCCFDYTTF